MSLKLRNLQALRGVACLLVVLFHTADWELRSGVNPTWLFLYPFEFFGYGGVDLFFVISGFIITWVHFDKLGRPSELPGYAFKRFWRIYPSFWVCMLGSVLILQTWLKLPAIRVPDFGKTLRWVTLLPQEHPNWFLIHTWSLTYELTYYLAFAAFFLLPRRGFAPVLAAWFAATVWLRYVARAELPFAVAFLVLPFTLEFLLGCFVALALRHRLTAGGGACAALGAGWILAGAWLNYAGWTQAANDVDHRFVLFGLPAALLVYGLTARESAGRGVLPRWLQSFGDASYSIYLWHVTIFFVVKHVTRNWTHTAGPHLLWVALMIGAAVGVGYLSYYRVERPLLDWARRRRGAAPAEAGAPLTRRAAA